MKFKLKAEKYPKVLKNNNGKYCVLYAEGTKGKEFDTKEEAEKYKKSIKSSKKVVSKLEAKKWYKINGYPLSLKFTGDTTRSGNLIFVKADGTQVVLDPSVENIAEEFDYEKYNKVASKKVKSGESYGWVVNPEDAWDKLQLWIDTVGAEAALDDIAKAMGTEELSSCLAFIFRNNDFKEGCSDFESEDDGE